MWARSHGLTAGEPMGDLPGILARVRNRSRPPFSSPKFLGAANLPRQQRDNESVHIFVHSCPILASRKLLEGGWKTPPQRT